MTHQFTHSLVKAFDQLKQNKKSLEPSEETLNKLRLLARVTRPSFVEA